MSTRTQTSSSPFSRLSLIGKGSSSRARESQRRVTGDDDYIPYTGTYEEPPRRRQEPSRDSWGDQVYDEDRTNIIYDLQQRYVQPDQPQYSWPDEDDDRKGRPRARTHSGVSGRTVSSGAVDPHRSSIGLLRKPSQNAPRPPVPSYINLDASGGVGESPVPPARISREVSQPPKRTSLASIFTFGQTSKKNPLSPTRVPLPISPPATSPFVSTRFAHIYEEEPKRASPGPPSVYSVSSDQHRSSSYHSHDDGLQDPFHSYYNYTPSADQFGQLKTPKNTTPAPHPYAYNLPKREIPDPPPSAPPITSPKLKFTAPPSQRFVFPRPHQEPPPPANTGLRVHTLKNSSSTPNLRSPSRASNRLRKQQPLSPGVPKGKDKWLSAETWCDAVMFPRPRLKVEDAQLLLHGGSGRIVSPPGSPVLGGFNAPQNPDRPQGMASRVLAHSRSMASLNNAEAGPSNHTARADTAFKGTTFREAPPPVSVVLPPVATTQTERPPRPKSFALDDLALPSPVPSLARVLEEGQILEHQRKKWQMQATGSFQNSRTRSLSRSRAKSLTQRGNKAQQSNMDFLAARSLLGNQDVIPILPPRHTRSASQSGTRSGTNTNATTSFNTRSSHSHSNSLAKTTSKSSHGNGHIRKESWGRSALNKATAICHADALLSPMDEKANGLETALRGGGTKVIRLADPAHIPIDMGAPISALSPRTAGPSPTPSAASDARMGIAISTPPPNDNSSVGHESLHLPSHPYAQSGSVSYSYHNPTPSVSKGADYAGPHPAITVAVADPRDFSARHRLPPQASLTNHPYASSSKHESYAAIVPQPRADSNVPAHSKMWAQLSSGVVREILPNELLYSPYMSERGTVTPPDEERDGEVFAHHQNRKSTVTILDSVGLGETLASAVEEANSRDSGLGTSEDHGFDGQAAAIEAHHPYRIHRKPVQYDISHTPYTPKKSAPSDEPQTTQSSPVDPAVGPGHRLTPPTPPLPTRTDSASSPAANSTASSPPRSPPPIGSVDDLDEFRDLFYKPNLTDEVLHNLSRPTSTHHPSVTWDLASTTQTQRTRTGSGLTSLARQLSAEFEELRAIRRERSGSVASESSISRFSGRFPRESDIQFVFTESEMARSMDEPSRREPSETMSAFHASHRLPEDVDVEESSRASSPIDGPLDDEDAHESFRVGNVESISTPPVVSSDHRSSFAGQLAFVAGTDAVPPLIVPSSATETRPIAVPGRRVVISDTLQPHSADPTRSSYMTESTLSRISNLSDFPAPPPQHMTPAHMSLLNAYFGESTASMGGVDGGVPEEGSEAEEVEDEEPTVTVPFTPRIGERF